VRGRPGKRFWESATKGGITRLVTLLSAREGAREIGLQAEALGLKWTWIPLEHAKEADFADSQLLRAELPQLAAALIGGESIVVHCAAGIHRTGTVAYTLLCLSGLTQLDAQQFLTEMRLETANGVTDERLAWADRLVDEIRSSEA
jgi:protein-tyrosine phosphatase